MRTEHGSAYYLVLLLTFLSYVTCDVSHIFQNHQSNIHPRQAQSNNFELTENIHGQNGNHDSSGSSTGWDIRLSVPGEPDKDYPTLSVIPKTAFNCVGKSAGYYADTQTRCQVFRVCANTAPEGFFSFLCPNGTLFNQEVLVCDWWMNVKCMDAEKYSDINNPKNTDDGSQMLSEIKKMIMYPMSNPYPTNLPPMNKVMQVYNPPNDMFSFLQTPVNQGFGNPADNNVFKLPGPFIGPITNTKDSAISGSAILNANRFYNNHQYNNQGARNEKSRNFFTSENFKGLNLHNAFDENTQAIKITKQQFTYPSQYDKEYTLRVPKLPLPHPFVVRLPINIPAIDTVPISTGEEIYQRQKYINQNIANFQAYNQDFESRFHNSNAKYSSDSVQGLTQKVERPVFEQIVQSPLPITKPYVGPSISDVNTQQNDVLKENYANQHVNAINTNQLQQSKATKDDSFKNASIHSTHFVSTSQPLPNGFRTQKQFTSYNQEVYGNVQNSPSGQITTANNELQKTVQNNNYKQYKAYSDATLENSKTANLYNQAQQVKYSNNSAGGSFDNSNINQINSAEISKNESLQFVSQHTQTTGKHTQTAVKSSQQYTVQNNAGISTDNRLGKVVYAEKQTNIRPNEENYQNGHLISVQQHFPSRIVTQPARVSGNINIQNQGVTQTITNVPQFTQSSQKESNTIQSTQQQYSGVQQNQNYIASQNTYSQNNQNIHSQHPQNMYTGTRVSTNQLNNIKTTNQLYNLPENQNRVVEGYRTMNQNQNQNQQYIMSNNQSPTVTAAQYDNSRYNQYNSYSNEQTSNNQNINAQVAQYNAYRMQLENQNRNDYYNKQKVQQNQNYAAVNVVQQPRDENLYTAVEVVPAIGYALNTQEERDHYYASIGNRYSPSIGAIVPIQTQNDRYMVNSAGQRNDNVVKSSQLMQSSRFGNENRLIHGQVIMHTRSQAGGNVRPHSLPLEDLGYPRERPDVEFTF